MSANEVFLTPLEEVECLFIPHHDGQEYLVNSEGYVLCPHCETKIAVGNGGIENFKQRHLPSKTCKKAMNAKQRTARN